MANTMPIAQKAKEEEDLRIMKGKLDFLRNPRHAAEHLSTFRQIFGRTMPIAVNERPVSLPPVPAKSNLTSKPNVYFSVEPSEVVFRDYEVGGVYEMGLAFRNLSSISRRIRVLPPASRFFSITTAKFPTADGLLAPGMSCQVSVRFAPDSLADYEDALTVVTELDRFPVALAGRRPPPSLTLRPALDCGYVLVGNHCLSKFSFENLGGAGRFRMVADRDWPEALSPLADDGSLALGAFQLFPAEFEMAPGAQQARERAAAALLGPRMFPRASCRCGGLSGRFLDTPPPIPAATFPSASRCCTRGSRRRGPGRRRRCSTSCATTAR